MGLLDQLTYDPQMALGMGLLGASGPSRMPVSLGQGLASAWGNMQNTVKAGADEKRLELQTKMLEQQVRMALQKDQMLQDLLSQVKGASPASQALSEGAKVGSIGPTLDNQSRLNSMQGSPQSGLAGVDPRAIAFDIAMNSGKNVGEWVNKRTTPDMQVNNGYAYDKNTLKPGFLPGVDMSQSGQTALRTIGPDGMPRISAPPGALETYGAYQNAGEAAKAGYDLTTINPAGQSPLLSTRKNVVDSMGMNAQDKAAVAAFKAAGSPGPDRPFNMEIKPSPAGIPVQSQSESAYKEGQAKDFSKQMSEIQTNGFSADAKIGKYTQLAKLYGDFEGGKLSKSAMDMAQLGNSLGIKIDKNLPNKEAAAALSNEIALTLRNPSGGAGMPGAMSDSDREFLRSMTPQLAQTADGRKMVVNAAIAIEQRNKDIAKFARKYEQKYGTLNSGFYEQLSSWSDANPLFGGK